MAQAGLIRGHDDFRRLWIGDGISKIGTSVALLALPVPAAVSLDASAWEVALLTTFPGLPYLLFGLPVGAWADRLRRQPTLVGRARLVEANSRLEANRTVAYTAGPTMAGHLVQWVGAPLALAGTVLGYLWSAVWIASIRTPERPPPRSAERSLVREIREGLRFVLQQPFIRATTFHATAAVLCLTTRYALEVLFLLRTVGLSAGGIGVLMTIAGAGSVAGALLAARIAAAAIPRVPRAGPPAAVIADRPRMPHNHRGTRMEIACESCSGTATCSAAQAPTSTRAHWPARGARTGTT